MCYLYSCIKEVAEEVIQEIKKEKFKEKLEKLSEDARVLNTMILNTLDNTKNMSEIETVKYCLSVRQEGLRLKARFLELGDVNREFWDDTPIDEEACNGIKWCFIFEEELPPEWIYGNVKFISVDV